MRVEMMKKYNLPNDFELSQGYLFYYDKIERANYFLEDVIATVNQDASSRLVSHLVAGANLIGDGGQWDMLVNIVQKYGIVPKSVFPETKSCVASRRMNQFLKNKLRQYCSELRKTYTANTSVTVEELRSMKVTMMTEYHSILSTFFGKPPTTFDWSFRNNKKQYRMYKNLTPLSFSNDIVPYDVDGYVSLIHDPRNPYYKHYTVANLGNVVGGFPIRYLNVPIDILRALTIKSIDSDTPVWFGCDFGKCMHREKGILHDKIYDYESTFGVGFGMNKQERLLYGESLMTHAMVITAYDRLQIDNVVDGEEKALGGNGAAKNAPEYKGETVEDADKHVERPIQKWRVENSHGTERGDKGYMTMSDGWFTEYVYQVAIKRELVGVELCKLLEAEAVVLPAWDPMGALAKVVESDEEC